MNSLIHTRMHCFFPSLALLGAFSLGACHTGGVLVLDAAKTDSDDDDLVVNESGFFNGTDSDDVGSSDSGRGNDTGEGGDTGNGGNDTGNGTQPCPWDGHYQGSSNIERGSHEWECDAEAVVQECQIQGTITCNMGGGSELELTGAAESGSASGYLQGSLGGWGSIDTQWNGTLDAGGLQGSFSQPEDEIEGSFSLTVQ